MNALKDAPRLKEAMNLRLSVVSASRVFRSPPRKTLYKTYTLACEAHKEKKATHLIQVLSNFVVWMNKEHRSKNEVEKWR